MAVVCVLTIALGMGGATSIFSVADAVVLRRLPYAIADQLVVIWQSDRDRNPFVEISYPAFARAPITFGPWVFVWSMDVSSATQIGRGSSASS
jgi:hypothetical protein